MDLCILIPAYQAEASVGDVVRGVRRSGIAAATPIVVIDDGSSDGTGAAAEAAGAVVLRHPKNQGKGAALQTGFAWALRHHADAVLTLDADGQHDPAEVPALAAAARAAAGALVIGVRCFEEMPKRNRTGNRISTYWISKFARRPHRDTQSGFRVYPRTLFDGTHFRTSRFDTETELLLLAAKRGIPLVEVPIRTIYPAEGAPTHFRDFRDTVRIMRLVIGSVAWDVPPERDAMADASRAARL